MTSRPWAALTVASLLLVACSDSPASDTATTAAPASSTAAPKTTLALAPAAFTVQPGTEQVAIFSAAPSTELSVVQGAATVATGVVDEQGSLLFRNLAPGEGYRITSATEASEPFAVWSPTDVPDPALYTEQQTLLPDGTGFGYIVTRDGTTLSANVILPGPVENGPYPTVVEYSGYQPSDPGSAQLAQLYTAQGFAYVGVNMRGTGCSGGSYRFFETVQSLDGYDAIEAVAAQPWVKDNQVGMVGI
ncbi:MAG: CocE/NonD family hydrolase, partial [Actinomycetota bacterium]